MPALSPEKLLELKRQFRKYDTSGDGVLSFKEMTALLRRGNPGMTDAEMRLVFDAVDANHDGKVDFDEFVEFIYAPPDASLPEDVKVMFSVFAGGGTMDGFTFAKLCKDVGLLDRKFAARDVDLIFAKVKPKGERSIAFAHFAKALSLIAEHKGTSVECVHQIIGDAEGPIHSGTKSESVRFFDDKDSYTGIHRAAALEELELLYPEKSWPLGARGSRPPRARSEPKVARVPLDVDTDWEAVQGVYEEYAGRVGAMEGRDFARLMRDACLCDDHFLPSDVDFIFAGVCIRGDRRIDLSQFQEALRQVAEKKGCDGSFVKAAVMECKGPPRLRRRSHVD